MRRISAENPISFSIQQDLANTTYIVSSKIAEQSSIAALYFQSKRLFDVALSLILIIFLIPLFLIIAVAVACTSRGPIVYRQRRLTWGGRTFMMYKFRTMRADAEAGSGAVMTSEKDPRITPLGRVLRRTRLDELPQLLNVVIGDMALIGPRPERPELAEKLCKELPQMPRRLEMRAGISGLAQIREGYAATEEKYADKLAWDIYYIEHKSLLLDFRIALETIRVVLTGFGAR